MWLLLLVLLRLVLPLRGSKPCKQLALLPCTDCIGVDQGGWSLEGTRVPFALFALFLSLSL